MLLRLIVVAHMLVSPGKLMGVGTSSGVAPPTFAITTESGVKLKTESNVVIRTEQEDD